MFEGVIYHLDLFRVFWDFAYMYISLLLNQGFLGVPF